MPTVYASIWLIPDDDKYLAKRTGCEMSTQTSMIFGQNKPDAGIQTNLFTVSSLHQAQVSIFVANQGEEYDRFTIALVPNSVSVQPENYLAYNTPLIGNGVIAFSGIYINEGDQVLVSSTEGNCSFTATGMDFGP